MRRYTVADTLLDIENPLPMEPVWDDFRTAVSASPADLSVTRQLHGVYHYGVYALHPPVRDVMLQRDSGILFARSDWKQSWIYAENEENFRSLLLTVLFSFLAARQSLLCHSSLVDAGGNGVLFLGPSGIGKTTQAELWSRFTGASILNGDMVFLRQTDDGFFGYGSPWHGSSPYCMNASVRIRALVLLAQAPENTLHTVTGPAALNRLLPQIFLPQWSYDATDACLGTLDALLAQVPVYGLDCRPDEDAVRLLQRELSV